ncbi:MAG: hypothetical protein JWM02_1441 [Frankiales bacterium]|nr:hypothetical protein [Frankiales bacterium]
MTDTGEPDGRLAQALSRPEDRAELLAALVDARVFAAISATSTAEHTVESTGLRAESSAELAVVLLESLDGSRALPVFPDVAALRRWRLDVRPVPLSGAQACAAALAEGAAVVLIDPAGAAVAVTELPTLAEGWVPVTGSALAARRAVTDLRPPPAPAPEALMTALRAALAGEGLRAARLLEGPDGPVLGIAAKRPLDPTELASLAQRIMRRLGERLPPDGLDLAQVPARGPGQDVLRGGWFRRGR